VGAGEVSVGDLFARHADALVHAHEVRRGVEAGAVAGGAQDTLEHSGGRALAVGPGDEHRGEAALRVAQGGQQRAHVRQVELVRGRVVQLVAEGHQLRDCRLVRQRKALSPRILTDERGL
jgi:hypothetical protein